MTRTLPYLILVIALSIASMLPAQHIRTPLPAPTGERTYTTGDAVKSAIITTPLSHDVDHHVVSERWATKLTRTSAKGHGLPEVEAIKAQKLAQKLASSTNDGWPARPKAIDPSVGSNFEGNWTLNQTPPDNSMAISNGGIIVTANNDEVLYMTTSGTILQFLNWPSFVDDPSLNANIYDPKVIYDSQEDRFVLAVLHGFNATTSKVLMCFSKTNDPTDGWWIYQLTGDPAGAGHWFDYPSLGVSNNEVYVTGNLFTSGSNQFTQAVIYQIEKAQGYAGGNLNWQYWSNLNSSPYAAFTLSPASWGQQGNYGPGILLVSNAPGGSSTIRVWDLTDDISGNPQLNAYNTTVPGYSPAANAQQQGSAELLDNGDCRILSSFYLSGQLHYVHHHDVGQSWNGVRYNRTDVSNLNTQTASFGAPGTADISYPALASNGGSNTDHDVLITFLASSSQLFPEIHVVNCDNNLQWSNSTLVKAGEASVNFQSGNDPERWGDYTGMARKHNENPPTAWLAACYGANNTQQGLNNTWKTWVAEVGTGVISGVEEPGTSSVPLRVFPNPVLDMFNVEFELQERAPLTIELIDAKGAVVRTLFSDTPNPAAFRFTFNRGVLAPGSYSLLVRTPQTTIAHEAVVVAE